MESRPLLDKESCLDRPRLLNYLQGSVSDAEARAVEAHLASCDKCEAAFLALDNLGNTLSSVYGDADIAMDQFAAESEFRQAVAALNQVAVGQAHAAVEARNSSTPQSLLLQGTAAPAAPAVSRRIFGEYELLECLGSGGMGKVYKARHVRLNRIVAVKMLQDSRLHDADAARRFDREMLAVGALDHPNIVRAMDAREVDGQRLLVMEFVMGIDLAMLVRRIGPLPIGDACEIIRQAALGLQSANEIGLVHRDIKPSNLMLATSGQVKVLDLGLALFHEQSPLGDEVTGLGQALGTAEYSSPEQISDSHRVDSRADIYSLGCTLFKLLSGHAPFDEPQFATRIEKLSAHMRLNVPDIRTVRPEVTEELAVLLARMTARTPAERISSMAEVADVLAKCGSTHDLPRLLKRAANGSDQSVSEERTSAICSSAMVSTDLSRQPPAVQESKNASRVCLARSAAGRQMWLRAVALCGVAAIMLLAGIIVIHWRDSNGPETVNSVNKPGNATVTGERATSIEAVPGNAKASLQSSDDSGANTVALKDFFKDVPGHWVPVLKTEKDLAGCQIFTSLPSRRTVPVVGGVKFQSDVMETKGRLVRLSTFRSAIQGIRAKFQWIAESDAGKYAGVELHLRDGIFGSWVAVFMPNGNIVFGTVHLENEQPVWETLATTLAMPIPRNVFVPIGLAAMGDTLVYEINGEPSTAINDNRVPFGAAAIGMKENGHAFFKDIEVFVPEKSTLPGNQLRMETLTAAMEHQERCGYSLGIPVQITNSVGMSFELIPAGKFEMGSTDADPDALADEKPQHQVKITRPFYLGTCEVTQAHYVNLIGHRPAHAQEIRAATVADAPETTATWDEALAFCKKLTELPGEKEARRVYRLPTEAQWEYACRAETTTRRSYGDSDEPLKAFAWYSDNCNGLEVHPVAKKSPNAWGLFDMYGNSPEWVEDWYDGNYYLHSPGDDPHGPASGSDHVSRGGSCGDGANLCRSACRAPRSVDVRKWSGFRVLFTGE